MSNKTIRQPKKKINSNSVFIFVKFGHVTPAAKGLYSLLNYVSAGAVIERFQLQTNQWILSERKLVLNQCKPYQITSLQGHLFLLVPGSKSRFPTTFSFQIFSNQTIIEFHPLMPGASNLAIFLFRQAVPISIILLVIVHKFMKSRSQKSSCKGRPI